MTLLHTEINPVYGGPNLEALEEMIFNGVTDKEDRGKHCREYRMCSVATRI